MRMFIAIEVPDATREALSAFCERLRDAGVRARWVKPAAMHLTLRFLGDITSEQATALCEALRNNLANVSGPTLLIRGLGAFPSLNKAAVFWAGVETTAGNLARVQAGTESSAQAIGLAQEKKPFHAHITLARLRGRREASTLATAAAPYLEPGMTPVFGHEFTASNVVLFSSTLTRRGPIYRPVEEFSLL